MNYFDDFSLTKCFLILLLAVAWVVAPVDAIKRDYQVSDDDDDAEEVASSGTIDISSSDLELISEGATAQIVGIRFRDVNIPQGTTITAAVLEFETDQTDSGTTSLTIRGEDVDDAAIFTTTNSDISDRTTTTASASWSPGAWDTVNERHQSTDISSVVQEIVDRVGWSSGNSMAFVFTGSGERTAESHDGESSAAPILRVEWAGQESIPGGQICYAVADSNDHFVLVDSSDGTVDTDVGDTGGSSIEAIALDPDDFAVYAADGDRLGRIRVDTGELVLHGEDFGTGGGSAGSVTFGDVDSLAFDPTTGTLWGVESRSGADALFQIDIDTGAHIPDVFGAGTDYVLVTGTSIGTQMDDIAIDPDTGTIYASDVTNSQLITINTSTGAGTVVGSFGSSIDMEGFGFRFDGVLVGTAGRRVYTVNLSTGAATQVGSGDSLTPGDDYESFDCHFTATSRALIQDMQRVTVEGRPAVRWQTAAEDGTIGFMVYRAGEDGAWQLVTPSPLPALTGAAQGGVYVLEDPEAGEAVAYRLVEIEANGRRQPHRSFVVNQRAIVEVGTELEQLSGSAADFTAGFSAAPHSRRLTRLAPIAAFELAQLSEKRATRRGMAAKIRISTSGMYRVDTAALEQAFSLSPATVQRGLRQGGFTLQHEGRPVAWTPAADGSSLIFYGEGANDRLVGEPLVVDPLAPENVYRLAIGRGLLMTRQQTSFEPSTTFENTFLDHHHAETDVFAGIAASPDPDSDFWFWQGYSAGTPGFDSRTLALDLVAPDPEGGQAAIAIDLLAVSDVGPHRIEVEINDRWVGEQSFSGRGLHFLDFDFPAEWLVSGSNEVTLTALLDPGTAHSFFYLDAVDVFYRRFAHSGDGVSLTFVAPPRATMQLDGFLRPEISIFDIEDPLRPRLVRDAAQGTQGILTGAGGTYGVNIRGLSEQRRMLATTADGLFSLTLEAWSEAVPSLDDSRRRADYLIIAPNHLLSAAHALADYRRAGGLESEVVELEDIYNAFGDGRTTPWAIRDFLHTALDSWQLPPRYVLLLGRGTFDHRGVLGVGDQLLPPLMAPGSGGIFDSPSRYLPADAEVAIGRLPVTASEQVDAYLERLRNHEAAGAVGRGLMAVDRPAVDADFFADAAGLNALVNQTVDTELLVIADQAAMSGLQTELVAGLDWLSFVGHGSTTAWGAGSFFSQQDLDYSTSHRPIVLAATCLTNRADLPGLPSLGEDLVLSPSAGAMAVVAPSGTTKHSDAMAFFTSFWQAAEIVESAESRRLGDLMIEARRLYRQTPGSEAFLSLLSMLGDPALQLPVSP